MSVLVHCLVATALLQAGAPSIEGGATPAAASPNLLIVLTDDQGYGDVGCYGADDLETPNLDRLAREGVRFTDFYVAQPVCSASRAALLTGCYPNRIGIRGALAPGSDVGLHPDEVTLAELCRARGYATALFGKWHLGHRLQHLPTRHGFDRFYGIPYSNDMWPGHPENPKAWGDLPTFEGERVVGYNTDQSRFTRDFTERAIRFIEDCARDGQPFFCYIPHPMPHVPLHVDEQFTGTSARGPYGDVIEELDARLGELLDTLERLDLEQDTLVLWTSDNGPWLSYGDHAGSSGSLREGKGTTFEGGVRVPCIARWPARLPAGSVCSEPAMTIDLLPTIAGWIGAELPDLPIDGRDVAPLFEGGSEAASPHEALFFWYHQGDLEAVRSGRWKLHFPHGYRTMVGREVGSGGRPGPYDYGARTGLELYDLELDPGERQDVVGEHPDVVERLVALADGARASLGDRLTEVEGVDVREPARAAAEDVEAILDEAVDDPDALFAALEALTRVQATDRRATLTDRLLDQLAVQDQIPFRHGETAVFLVRETAQRIGLAGDFNGWSPTSAPLESWGPLGLWVREERFPSDARFDYKLVLDGERWLLDRANPRRQRSGFGENSELRMPEYVPSRWTSFDPDVPAGVFGPERVLTSTYLDCGVTYRVYEPPGGGRGCATLYVTDGHEYADPDLGALTVTLDNLIAAGRIEPLVAVFVDPRIDGINRRAQLFVANQSFIEFLARELVPTVEAVHGTRSERGARGIVGTSLGGVCALFAALEAEETFGAVLAQSPALRFAGSELEDRLRTALPRDTRYALSVGTAGDGEPQTRALAAVLGDLGAPTRLDVRNEGHSWGQWRKALPDALEHLFGPAR